ncbi:MAG TPA: glycosyltransferase, partial [Dehalococcoidia bacterium]
AAKLLAALDAGADVAIGSRVQPDGSDMRASQPRQRRIVGRIFTLMRKSMRILPDIDDTQCPLKGFQADVARAVFERQRLRGWIFDAEVLYIARSLDYGIVAVPVQWAHVEGSRLRVRPSQAYEVLRDLLRLLQSGRNEGKGAAIRRGCLDARGELVLFMDADLATPPDEAAKLLAALDAGADVAIGSRVQPDGSDMRASQPRQRRIVGRVFTLMRKSMRILPDIDDTQCPLKGFQADVARAVFARQRLRGWIFDAEVLYIARSLRYRIVSVPVRWAHVEGSRLRVRPSQAYEVLRDLLRLRLGRGGG